MMADDYRVLKRRVAVMTPERSRFWLRMMERHEYGEARDG